MTQSQSDEEGRVSVRGMEGAGGVAHHKNASRTVKESVFIAIHSLWLAVFEGVVCVSRGNSFSLLTISRPQVQFSIMLFFPAFPRQLQLRPCKEQHQQQEKRQEGQTAPLLIVLVACVPACVPACVCVCLRVLACVCALALMLYPAVRVCACVSPLSFIHAAV